MSSFDKVVNAAAPAFGGFLGFLQQQSQNEFNAQEAEKNREFQERMSSTAYQRAVLDMQRAGLNPALMYGGAGASGASTPSGSTASASGFNAIADALSIAKLGEELRGMRLDNENKKTQGEGFKLDNEQKQLLIDWYPKLSQGTLDEISSRLKLNAADVDLKNAQKDVEIVNKELAELNKEWLPRLNDAREKNDLASAAHSYAEAAISQYERSVGHRLGSSEALTIASAIIEALGGDSSDPHGVVDTVIDAVNSALEPVDNVLGYSGTKSEGFLDKVDDLVDDALGINTKPLRGFYKHVNSKRPKLFGFLRRK